MSKFFQAPVPEVILMTWLVMSCIFFVTKRLEVIRETKQLAWLVSAMSAFVLVVGSVPFQCDLWRNGGTVGWAKEESFVSRALAGFFFASLGLDLGLGIFNYPAHLDLLTAWIHHPTYMLVLLYSISKGYTTYFAMMLPMELPTLIMSLGILDERLRNYFLFGLVFFVTRILYHIFMIVTWYHQAEPPTYYILAAFLPFHLFWFRGFLRQQRRLRDRLPKPTDPLLAPSIVTN